MDTFPKSAGEGVKLSTVIIKLSSAKSELGNSLRLHCVFQWGFSSVEFSLYIYPTESRSPFHFQGQDPQTIQVIWWLGMFNIGNGKNLKKILYFSKIEAMKSWSNSIY